MRKRTKWVTGLAIAAAVTVGASTAAVQAQSNPYERGPNPTESAIERAGPFSVTSTTVSSWRASGFGGAEIFYPRDTSEGTFGGVAISPGFTAGRSTMEWIAERVASHGFVVISIDTNSRWDYPDSRGRQLLAALEYLTEDSSVRSRVDEDRLAVAGHSMGGGGTLAAAESDSSLQAAVPLAPWHSDKTWGSVRVPTFIIGGENDSVASVRSHSEPFYESMYSAPDKAYMELSGAGHFFPNGPDTQMGKYSVSWLKRFVDNDTRYEQFLCPAPNDWGQIEEYRDTCPHS